jgi:hypothetical protein
VTIDAVVQFKLIGLSASPLITSSFPPFFFEALHFSPFLAVAVKVEVIVIFSFLPSSFGALHFSLFLIAIIKFEAILAFSTLLTAIMPMLVIFLAQLLISLPSWLFAFQFILIGP